MMDKSKIYTPDDFLRDRRREIERPGAHPAIWCWGAVNLLVLATVIWLAVG